MHHTRPWGPVLTRTRLSVTGLGLKADTSRAVTTDRTQSGNAFRLLSLSLSHFPYLYTVTKKSRGLGSEVELSARIVFLGRPNAYSQNHEEHKNYRWMELHCVRFLNELAPGCLNELAPGCLNELASGNLFTLIG
jgi:hypothetical protein